MLRIALTPGDPAGIGPDLALKIAQQERPYQLVCIANKAMLAKRAELLGLNIRFRNYDASSPPQPSEAGELCVQDVKIERSVSPGELNKHNAAYVLKTLQVATDGCLKQEFAAVVTGPVQKSIINDSGVAFSGHTEFFAEKSRTAKVVMMLATEGLRVALATTHLPLKDVSAAISSSSLREVIDILLHDLKTKFGLPHPKILVCGLNPHAGEGGHLGMEEIEIITPVLDEYRAQGVDVLGPLPADTLFTPERLVQADAVLAMYHDQGLPVLKYKGFGNAVNITLGLPFIRTSVDHGTALDLAGSGKASTGSIEFALKQAMELAYHAQTQGQAL